MPALRIGIELASLHLPFKKALHTAAELGADAVEIDARGEFRPQQLARTGLSCTVGSDERLTHRLPVFIQRLDDEEFYACQSFSLARGDQRADHSSELHLTESFLASARGVAG